jgi:hypothetical protein
MEIDAVTQIELDAVVAFLRRGVTYQSRVARILRTISEAAHFGRYVSSTRGKLINLVISRGAARRLASVREPKTYARVEHPLPLEIIYGNLELSAKSHARELGAQDVLEALRRYPLVTVTKDENQQLKHTGWTTPAERYENAGVEVGRVKVLELGRQPEWRPTALTEPESVKDEEPT